MLWLLRKIVDRLLVKSVVIIGSELESQMEMEIGEARAELLRRRGNWSRRSAGAFRDRARAARAGDAPGDAQRRPAAKCLKSSLLWSTKPA